MNSPDSSPIVLHTDQEHDNLRTVVILLLLSFFFLSFWLVNTILKFEFWGSIRDYAVSLSCVFGLVLALAISAGTEIWLKRVWPSGRSLTLNKTSIRIQNKSADSQQISLKKSPAHLRWYFHLKGYRRGGREKRLPRNSVCLAYQLQQGETRLIAHSYMSPDKAKRWLDEHSTDIHFHEIHPEAVYESSLASRFGTPSRPTITNEILTGSDGRYWLAERHRWEEGFELTPQDFAVFMDKVAAWQSSKVVD